MNPQSRDIGELYFFYFLVTLAALSIILLLVLSVAYFTSPTTGGPLTMLMDNPHEILQRAELTTNR